MGERVALFAVSDFSFSVYADTQFVPTWRTRRNADRPAIAVAAVRTGKTRRKNKACRHTCIGLNL